MVQYRENARYDKIFGPQPPLPSLSLTTLQYDIPFYCYDTYCYTLPLLPLSCLQFTLRLQSTLLLEPLLLSVTCLQ